MIKITRSYETSDGETFATREAAEEHEQDLAVAAFFGAELLTAGQIADRIRKLPAKARAALMPLMPVARPRKAKGGMVKAVAA